jgi:O-antigen/teichoic acid export membrane protein
MKVRRILKTSGAFLCGQGVNVGSQLLLPPLFLHSYGVDFFGEWITLTAAVSYLGTLNFGLATFANNHVGFFYSRGELDEVKTLQGTAFALLLSIVSAAALVTLIVFFLPISSWLKLELSSRTSSLIIYLLGLQVLTRIISNFLAGSFLVVGVSYRGTNWNNAQSTANFAGTALLAFERASFASIAGFQLLSALAVTILIALDLHAHAPAVFPRLSNWQASRIKAILKPSGYFAMLYSSNFLVYQLPVIIMQRFLGSQQVVVFSLTRTIYSMSRQMLNVLSFAIGPEIVELYGQKNWPRLLRLYDLSERIVFALVPIVSVGTFLATPVLMSLWLHKPELYDAKVCIVMALLSAVIGTKEHKYQFQISSNEHHALARFWLGSYLSMLLLSIPAIYVFGVEGFLVLWLCTEVIQVAFVLHLNRRFFKHATRLDFNPVYKLGLLMSVAMAGCAWLTFSTSVRSLVGTGVLAMGAVIALAAISVVVFRLTELGDGVFARLTRRI